MIKPAVIGTLVVLILYNFFGITLILGLLSIALVLLGLIYLNQNKILYMPGTYLQKYSYSWFISISRNESYRLAASKRARLPGRKHRDTDLRQY